MINISENKQRKGIKRELLSFISKYHENSIKLDYTFINNSADLPRLLTSFMQSFNEVLFYIISMLQLENILPYEILRYICEKCQANIESTNLSIRVLMLQRMNA